ncbi:MAG: type II toxin-antitoxin system RelE family toxin [Holosporales bacterium]
MLKIDLSKNTVKALQSLPPKHQRQVSAKILSLQENPQPHDSIVLKSTDRQWRRVDSGEYRIIYRTEASLLKIAAVGHRNDDRVYRDFERGL